MHAASKWLRLFFVTLFLGLGSVGLAACDQGPAEEAGENIDDAVDDTEDTFD